MFDITVEASSASLARVLERLTRRQVSRRMTVVGNNSVQGCNRQAAMRFTPRQGDRRRYPGSPHVQGSFSATYTGLGDFAAGVLEVTVKSTSPIMNILEYGSGGHDILPVNAKVLSWPGMRKPRGVKWVHHPGSTKHVGLMENVVASNLRSQFPGINPRFTR